MSAWKPIKREIKRKVLVTNNVDARDAHGRMSHVWVVGLVQKDGREFIAFDDHMQRLWGLSHYAELPA